MHIKSVQSKVFLRQSLPSSRANAGMDFNLKSSRPFRRPSVAGNSYAAKCWLLQHCPSTLALLFVVRVLCISTAASQKDMD